MESEIRTQIIHLLKDKLQRLAIRDSELGDNFDLVKSGLLNSLEFVDLVASIERIYNCEIDFEEALEKGDFTTIGGLIRGFETGK